jgi:transcriptional regulator with XRE-family HTH domain
MSSMKDSAPGDQSLLAPIAINIRCARERQGMSVEALAGSAGCTPEFIADLERGCVPESATLGALEAIASALATDVEELVSK